MLLVPETDAEGGCVLAEKLRHAVAEYPFVGRERQPEGRVTMSLGVATFPGAGDNSRALIDHVDKALYRSKHAGRNRVSVWDD